MPCAGLIAVLIFVAACSTGPVTQRPANPEPSAVPKITQAPPVDIPPELAGKRRASGATEPDPQGHRMGWTAEYDFHADGTFTMTGYPAISVEGRIKVVGHDGSRLHLVLTQRKMGGSDWPDLDQWATLAADGKSLQFDGKDFHR